jgi:hypothetical protein
MGSVRRRNSTRARRASSRASPPVSLKTPVTKPSSVNTHSLAESSVLLDDIAMRLEIVYAVLVTAASALKGQNCEIDSDVANAIQHSGTDVLSAQIERLRDLLDADSATGERRQ